MTEEQFFGKELAACKIDAIPGMIEFDIPVHGAVGLKKIFKRKKWCR